METNPKYIYDNSCLIEFNANSIIENDLEKPNEEQYVVFTMISNDDFGFVNDYKTASKKHFNKSLIYANKGRIKEFLNDINNKENNLNNSDGCIKDDKKDGDNDDKISNAKKQKSQNLCDGF